MKRFRNAATLVAIVLMTSTFIACGTKKKSDSADNTLGKMEVVIPDELKDNEEIVEYIQGMSEVVDEYALLMNKMITDLDGLEGKEWEELRIGEQLKLTRAAATFAVKAAPITARWAEYEFNRSMYDDDLTEEELMALQTVMERFEARMKQIEEKNEKFFGGIEG
ncbi:MAG: hypothetical protein WD052_07695 [Bacteroidales bacterium]